MDLEVGCVGRPHGESLGDVLQSVLVDAGGGGLMVQKKKQVIQWRNTEFKWFDVRKEGHIAENKSQ